MQKEMNIQQIDILLADIIQNIVLSKYVDNTIGLDVILDNFNSLLNECDGQEIREKEYNILVRLNQILQRVYGDNTPNLELVDDEYLPNKVDNLRNLTLKNIQEIQLIINKLDN